MVCHDLRYIRHKKGTHRNHKSWPIFYSHFPKDQADSILNIYLIILAVYKLPILIFISIALFTLLFAVSICNSISSSCQMQFCKSFSLMKLLQLRDFPWPSTTRYYLVEVVIVGLTLLVELAWQSHMQLATTSRPDWPIWEAQFKRWLLLRIDWVRGKFQLMKVSSQNPDKLSLLMTHQSLGT